MKKRLLSALFCFLLAVLFLVVFCYGCWLLRRDCLCYKAMFHQGESLPIDDIVLKYTSPQPGVMTIQTIECEHGQKMWLNITEGRYYVQWFGK